MGGGWKMTIQKIAKLIRSFEAHIMRGKMTLDFVSGEILMAIGACPEISQFHKEQRLKQETGEQYWKSLRAFVLQH